MFTILSDNNEALYHTGKEPPSGNYIHGKRTLGMVWNGSRMVSPPRPLPYQTAGEASQAMVAWIDRLTSQVLSKYPASVRERWPKEEAAAYAVKAGNATAKQTQMITDEGATKGRTPVEHADIIIGHAQNFEAISGEVNKLFLATDAALFAEPDPANFVGILDAAKVQAKQLAVTYGLEIQS